MRFIYTKTFRRLFVVLVLVAFIIVSDAKGYLSKAKGIFFEVYGEGTSFISNSAAKTKNFFATFLLIKGLSHENDLLKQKVDELAFENARLKAAKQENQTLRRALNFAEETELGLIPAVVKFLDPTGFTQTLMLDVATDAELKLNAAVVSQPGLLVGKITNIYDNAVEVTLITDPSIKINGIVVDSGASGLVTGEHGLSLRFDLITHNEVIKPGDKILTSGLAGDFPKGILIGEISSLSSSPSELFQKAFVQPAADLRNLKFLFIVAQ